MTEGVFVDGRVTTPWSPKVSLSTPQPDAPWAWGAARGAAVAGPVPAGGADPVPFAVPFDCPIPLSSARKLALSSLAAWGKHIL